MDVAVALPVKEVPDVDIFRGRQIVADARLRVIEAFREPGTTVRDGATRGVQRVSDQLLLSVI
jgi:hypothetical protein